MNDLKIPGDLLAREEEFEAGKNTYLDEEGNIVATKIGMVKKDYENKVISIYAKNEKIIVGDTVEALITNIKGKMILTNVNKIKGKSNYINSAAILMQNVSESYIKSTDEAAKIGDIIIAKIVSIKPGIIDLSMKGKNLGVITAFCSKCRNKLVFLKKDMQYKDFSILKCPVCGNIEKRKTAETYVYKNIDDVFINDKIKYNR